MLVLALHTAYLGALATGALDGRQQMLLALAAYASYVVNATQFVVKLRAARRDQDEATRRDKGELGQTPPLRIRPLVRTLSGARAEAAE